MHWASDSTTEWWNCLWRFSRALSNRLHVGKPHVYQMLSSLPTRIHDPLSQENHTSCKLLWQTKPFLNYAFPLHYHSTALVYTAWFQSTVEFIRTYHVTHTITHLIQALVTSKAQSFFERLKSPLLLQSLSKGPCWDAPRKLFQEFNSVAHTQRNCYLEQVTTT